MQSTNDQARAVLRTFTPTQLARLDLETLIAPFWHLFSLTGPNLSAQQFREVWELELQNARDEVTQNRRSVLAEIARHAHEGYVSGMPLPTQPLPPVFAHYAGSSLMELGIDQTTLGDIWHVVYGLLDRVLTTPDIDPVVDVVPEPEIGIAVEPVSVLPPLAMTMPPEPIAVPRRIEPAEPTDRTGDYTLAEMAEGFGVDVETVNQWIKRACLITASDGKVTEKTAHRFLRQHEAEVKLTDTNGLWLETLKRLPKQGMRLVCPECRKAGRVQDAA